MTGIWKEGERKFSSDTQFAAHAQFGGADINVGTMHVEGGFHFDGVARTDAVLEAHLVDAGVESQLADEVVFHQQGTGLGHDFAEDDARNDGFTREMAFQEKLLTRDMIFGMGHVVFVEGHLVHQEHGLAVREVLFDFFSIHVCVFDPHAALRLRGVIEIAPLRGARVNILSF